MRHSKGQAGRQTEWLTRYALQIKVESTSPTNNESGRCVEWPLRRYGIYPKLFTITLEGTAQGRYRKQLRVYPIAPSQRHSLCSLTDQSDRGSVRRHDSFHGS